MRGRLGGVHSSKCDITVPPQLPTAVSWLWKRHFAIPDLQKLRSIYEPGLSVDGSLNMDWAPQCQAQLDQGKYCDALVTFIHGLTPASRSLPRWLFRIIIWFMVKPQVLQRKYSLLHTAIPEHAE